MMEPSKHRSPFAGPRWFERLGRASWLLLGIVGAMAVIVVGVKWFSDLVIPLVLASFLAAILMPVVDFLTRRGVPRFVAAGLVIIGFVGLFVGSMVVVVVGIVDQSDELTAQFNAAQEQLAGISEKWDLQQYFDQLRELLTAGGSGSGVGARLGTAVGSTFSFLTGLALGFVFLYYLLKDGRRLVAAMVGLAPVGQRGRLHKVARNTVGTVQSYFRGRTILSLVQGIVVGVVMLIAGVPLPFAIAIVTFITAYIPYLGAFIGGAFAVVMGLAAGGLPLAAVALFTVLFVNIVLENALEPALQGSVLNLHPIVILLATVAGGLIAGMVGFILASPATAIAKGLWVELKDAGFFDDPDRDVPEPAFDRNAPGPAPDPLID